MNKFEVLAGRHTEGGKVYKKGETFMSADDWHVLFPEKYRLVNAAPVPVLNTPAARAARVVDPNPDPDDDLETTKRAAAAKPEPVVEREEEEEEDEEEEQLKKLSKPKSAPAKASKKKVAKKAKDGFN